VLVVQQVCLLQFVQSRAIVVALLQGVQEIRLVFALLYVLGGGVVKLNRNASSNRDDVQNRGSSLAHRPCVACWQSSAH